MIKKNNDSRYKLAEAMKVCMKSTSVENITVKQIVEEGGFSRQTFYRNFIDKYDLINWYFDRLLEQSFREMGSGETVREGYIRKFKYIKAERVFFTAAFKVDEQNNLKEHDFFMIYEFFCGLIRDKSGTLPDHNVRKILEMYCQAAIYMTVKWTLGGMKETEEELAELMIEALPLVLKDIFVSLKLL